MRRRLIFASWRIKKEVDAAPVRVVNIIETLAQGRDFVADGPDSADDVEAWVRYTVLIPKSLHDKIERFRTELSRVTRMSRADATRQLIDYGVDHHPRPRKKTGS